jgi:hypothetical protein
MSFSLVRPDIRAVIRCGYCPGQIVLPFPALESNSEDQDWWPNQREWLYIACPECRQVAAHIGCCNEVISRSQSELHKDKFLLRISFLCAGQSCGVPVQFHVLQDSTVTENTESELRELLASNYWRGLSPCGHPINISGNQKVSFDLPTPGRPQGYNRRHAFWRSSFQNEMNPLILGPK